MDIGIMDVLKLLGQEAEPRLEIEEPNRGTSLNPGMLGSDGKEKTLARPGVKVEAKFKTKEDMDAEAKKAELAEDDIFSQKDLRQQNVFAQMDDRTVPEYEILYRQKVGAEDVFLGLSNIDNSTDHCPEMTVKISLPNTQMRQVTLDVSDRAVKLQAPKFKLDLTLPYDVDAEKGNAKFDSKKGELNIVLPIRQQVSYVNIRDLNAMKN